MAGFFTNKGVDLMIRQLIGQVPSTNLKLRLFVNDVVVSSDTEMSDLIEPDVGNYLFIDMTPSLWYGGVYNYAATYSYPTQTFNFTVYTGDQLTVYGFFIEDQTTGTCMYAQNTDPRAVNQAGDSIPVSVSFNLRNCY